MRALFSTFILQQPDESSLVSSTVAHLLTLATSPPFTKFYFVARDCSIDNIVNRPFPGVDELLSLALPVGSSAIPHSGEFLVQCQGV